MVLFDFGVVFGFVFGLIWFACLLWGFDLPC